MGLLDRASSAINKAFGHSDENGVDELESVSDQTPDEQKLAAYVKGFVEDSRSNGSRVSHEGIWMTNTAYLLGFDGIYYDTKSRQFRTQAQSSGFLRRNRVHANKILPSCQNRLARLCKNPPRYDTRPSKQTAESKVNARKSLMVLNNVMDENEANTMRLDLYMWNMQCGHAYVKVSWDETMGDPIVDPITGEFEGFQGGTRLDVASAFEVFPDPLAKSQRDLRKIAHAKVRTLDYFKQQWPERGHLVKEEGAWLLSAQYEQRINSLNNLGQGQNVNQVMMKNSAIEIAYYEARSSQYPNGRMIVEANGVLLCNKELPLGEIPLVKFDDVRIGGKYYSESIITHARPLQDQYNRLLTQRSAWVNKMLHGKWMAPKGHGMGQESVNDQSGEIWEYNPGPNGQKPEPVQVPVIPSYAYEEEENLAKNIDDVFGVHDISRGELPSAGIPALGMQILTEQDDTRDGIVTESNELAWAKVGRLCLKSESKFRKLAKTIKTKGKGSEIDFVEYSGEDLTGEDDVFVIRGSTLPNSKTLKRQEILNLRSQGLLGNPQDPSVNEKIMEFLEYGDTYQAWDQTAADTAQIAKDIEMIKQEIVPPFNEYDNHGFHFYKKNLFRIQESKDLSTMSLQILNFDLERRVAHIMTATNPGLAQAQSQIQLSNMDAQATQGNLNQAQSQLGQEPQPGGGGEPPPPQM
jgi:hypothetical protein